LPAPRRHPRRLRGCPMSTRRRTPAPPALPPLMSLREATAYLHLGSPRTLQAMMRTGEITARKGARGELLFARADLDALLVHAAASGATSADVRLALPSPGRALGAPAAATGKVGHVLLREYAATWLRQLR